MMLRQPCRRVSAAPEPQPDVREPQLDEKAAPKFPYFASQPAWPVSSDSVSVL